jgi:hypothetical protein
MFSLSDRIKIELAIGGRRNMGGDKVGIEHIDNSCYFPLI